MRVHIIHPDPLTAGAIRETKRIADYATMHGVETALHFAGSPLGCMASVHMAATLRDMLAMENHAVDIPTVKDKVSPLPFDEAPPWERQVPETPMQHAGSRV